MSANTWTLTVGEQSTELSHGEAILLRKNIDTLTPHGFVEVPTDGGETLRIETSRPDSWSLVQNE